MIKRFVFPIVAFVLSLPTISHADPVTEAPRMVNLQAVLIDQGGNVLYNQHEADITFTIIDGTNKKYYEEVQHVIIVNGAMSVLIGNGKDPVTGQVTGGIPYEALRPDTGTKLLRYKLNDQTIPQEDVALASVPYAFYSQYATDLSKPLESKSILDGTIMLEDLSADLKGWFDSNWATQKELTDHKTEEKAHPASSVALDQAVHLTNIAGTNLQDAIKSIDMALNIKSLQDKFIADDIAKYVGDLSTHAGADIGAAHPNGSLPASRISGQIATAQIADGAVTAAKLSGALGGGNIADKAVTNEKLADDAVTSDKIKDSSVVNADLATDAVTTEKIKNETITTADLATVLAFGVNDLVDMALSIGDGAGLRLPQGTADPANTAKLEGLLFWDKDDGLLRVSTTGGWVTASNPFGTDIDSTEIKDGSITNADISPAAAIADSKLATITTAGKVADSALSNTVTKLGSTIESTEIVSLDSTKLTGTIDDTRLSATVTKLGQTIESTEIASLDAAKLTGTIADSLLSSNVTKLGQTIESTEISDNTISTADLASKLTFGPDDLLDLSASINDGAGIRLPQANADPANTGNLAGLLFWDKDDELLRVSTGSGWKTAGNPFGTSIDSSEITDGTIANIDISPTAAIADTKLATISTAGKVSDSALSSTVTKLGQTIESTEISDGAVTNSKIFDGAVTNGKIGNNEVNSIKIENGTIIAADLATDSVSTDKIQNLAVITEKINNGAVTKAKMADNSVDNPQLVNGAVTNSKIADFAITNGKLGNGEIDNIKIADNAITNGKIKNGEINSEKIGDGTIATADIADGAVTTAKLATGATISKATSLAADGTNCSAGQYPTGIDAQGNAQECTKIDDSPDAFTEYAKGQISDASQGVQIYSKTLDDNSAYALRAVAAIYGRDKTTGAITTYRHYIRDGLIHRNGGSAVWLADSQAHAIGTSDNPKVRWEVSGNNAVLLADGGPNTIIVNYSVRIDGLKVEKP